MKKILFLTGTRADFGKIKSLIQITNNSDLFEIHIFATGMHMNSKYGKTVDEIEKCKFPNIFKFYNHSNCDDMSSMLAKTIDGFSSYVKDINPDIIIVHGDRVEALAGAIVGTLNNVLTAHIEGGEVSGTVDEIIRHSVSKMCHVHFVSNNQAKKRLIQMGENEEVIYVIGSPDIDIMKSDHLPPIDYVKKHYDITFDSWAILIYHPVTTEIDKTAEHAKQLVNAVLASNHNYIVIYPNNDKGSDFILNEYKRFSGLNNIKIFPSIRFEYFLSFLKHSRFIIGNSSTGIREASYFGVPCIDIGSRQYNRVKSDHVIPSRNLNEEIQEAIGKALNTTIIPKSFFGKGESDILFFDILKTNYFWNVNRQKYFNDLNIV